MSESLTEDQIRDKIVQIRQREGLTIGEISERFPKLSRSKVGRMLKGIKPNSEETIETRDNEIEKELDSEIVENPSNPLENMGIGENENPILSHETSQHTPRQNAEIRRFIKENPISTSQRRPGRVSLGQNQINAIRNMLTKSEQRVFDATLDVAIQEEEIQRHDGGQLRGGQSGLGMGGYLNQLEGFISRMMAQRQAMELMNNMFPGSNSKSSTDEMVDKLIIAKVLSGNNQMDAKQLVSFASSLKTLFGSSEDSLKKYIEYQRLEDQAISKNRETESAIYERAKKEANAQANKSLIHKVVDEVVPPLKKLASGMIANAGNKANSPPPPPTREEMLLINRENIVPEEAHLPSENTENQSGGFGDGGESSRKPRKKHKITKAKEVHSNIAEVKES